MRDYLTSIQWDGKPRVAEFFTTYATGAANTERTSDIATKWFVSAVARAMQPGCRVDQHLVLCGPQGSGKTKLLTNLFGDQPNDGAFASELSKCWVVEAELDLGMRTKAFLTTTSDTYYQPYKKDTETSLRTCVIVLTDENAKRVTKVLKSGSRRLWPMSITACAAFAIEGDRDQLWAEAKHLFTSGVKWWD
jgi:putative DNA primase/helicase